jgi:hypothetical protein
LVGAQTFRLLFHGESGKSYLVQFRDSLGSGSWIDLKEISPLPEPGMVEVTDLLPPSSPSRYYRISEAEQ